MSNYSSRPLQSWVPGPNSAAVNQSLAETVRRSKLEQMTGFFGKNLWEGQLSEMREDRPETKAR